MDDLRPYVVLGVGLLCWCTLHSLLITTTLTSSLADKWPSAFRYYRLFYNTFSIVSLLPVGLLYLSVKTGEESLYTWTMPMELIRYALLLVSLLLFIGGARVYDLKTFLGISQIRDGGQRLALSKDAFITRGVTRYVRHPWYLGGILFVWSFPATLSFSALLVAIILTGYFLVGGWLEDRKLVVQFGESYQEYMAHVPGIIPLSHHLKK